MNTENPATLIASKNSNKYRWVDLTFINIVIVWNLIFRIQSNGIAPLAFVLNVLIKRLCPRRTSDQKASKAVVVKTVPQSTVDFLLTTIEKQHNMKNEMKKVIVSWNYKSNAMKNC